MGTDVDLIFLLFYLNILVEVVDGYEYRIVDYVGWAGICVIGVILLVFIYIGIYIGNIC